MSSPDAALLTQTKLDELVAAAVAQRVEALLPPSAVEAIAAARIDARIRELTIEEACDRLRCKNLRQLQDKCRALRIPIYKDRGQKSQYLLLAEIESGQAKFAERVPPQPFHQRHRHRVRSRPRARRLTHFPRLKKDARAGLTRPGLNSETAHD